MNFTKYWKMWISGLLTLLYGIAYNVIPANTAVSNTIIVIAGSIAVATGVAISPKNKE